MTGSVVERIRRKVRRTAKRVAARAGRGARPGTQQIYDTFADSRGNTFELQRGFRDRLKPGWRTMLEPPPESLSKAAVAQSHRISTESVQQALRLLATFGPDGAGPEIRNALEIGCFDGRRSYALAGMGIKVTALDLTEYYVEQSPEIEDRHAALARASARLARFRAQTREAFEKNGVPAERLDRVEFVDQDVCSPALPAGAFDLVVSWEVLEHIHDPEAAFRAMFRVMRPGGLAFHEYNPFFCLSGGHSLCTVDFPYGHARLTPEDFERLVRRHRPDEADQDLRFFHNNLNRMTLSDLAAICERVGFETLALLQFPRRDDLELVDAETLEQVREIHPTATLNDLLSRTVWLALRKPGE